MAILKDLTLQGIKASVSDENEAIVNAFKSGFWSVIQTIVKSGNAKRFFNIGDELACKISYNKHDYDFPWIVVDNDRECEWEDGSKHPGLWLNAKYALPNTMELDAPEQSYSPDTVAQEGVYYFGRKANSDDPLNPLITPLNLNTGDQIPKSEYNAIFKHAFNDLSIVYQGYNRYSQSCIRLHLNNLTIYWNSQHVGDVGASYSYGYGFAYGMPRDFLDVINPIKIKTIISNDIDGEKTDITYDRFFLPSIEEFGGQLKWGSKVFEDSEGLVFPYWQQKPTGDSDRLFKLAPIASDDYCDAVWTRSAVPGATVASFRYTADGLTDKASTVNAKHGILPACVIS